MANFPYTRVLVLSVFAVLLASCAPLAVGAAGGAAGGAVETARAADDPSYGPGTYAATILSSAVYFPAKVVFAGAGGLTSGLAYLVTFGDTDVSRPIWDASVGGDYLIQPDQIEGQRPIRFVG